MTRLGVARPRVRAIDERPSDRSERRAAMLRIGQSQLRFEDEALLQGRGGYLANRRCENEAAMVLVRSPYAAGRVRAIDVSAAAATPGVLAVLTGAEMLADGVGTFVSRLQHPGPDGGAMRVPDFHPLASDAVRYVGDPVAVVIGESQAAAELAAEAVVLDVEERPAVVDALKAVAADAPRVWEVFPDNRCFRFSRGDRETVATAIAGARHVVRQRLRISRVTAAPMEARGALASFDPAAGCYRLELGTQTPHRLAADLAPVLQVPLALVRVIARDCGGSFGMKNVAHPEYVIALWAARRVGRPVRWTASRLESFQADAHARDQWADATLALDADGRFLALDVHVLANLGAYLGPATTHPPTANIGGMAGVYRTPTIHVTVEGVFTNTQQTAPYRGAGRPEATYVIERMVDLAALELGLDKVELRRRNLATPADMPFKTGLVFTYDSGDFPGVLERALDASDYAGFVARRAACRRRGRLRGFGIANPIEIAGGPAGKPHPEFARLELTPDGAVRLWVGSSDSGQGHGTAYRQILSDRLGLAPDAVTVITGDTGDVPHGNGTFGSRTLAAAGTAICTSLDEIVERLRGRAADLLEAAAADLVFEDAAYRVRGTDRGVAFKDVLATEPEPVTAEALTSASGATFPNGCHLCEVEVDPETGQVEVVGYVVVDDVGTVLNPLLVKGQIAGGVAQGLGQALMENVVYDQESGQLLSATFMDYAMPRAVDLPKIAVESFPVPTVQNPLGVKGVGEAGTVGALAAVMSAVCDALAQAGVRHLDMPATPERVWRSLHARCTTRGAAAARVTSNG